MKHRPRLMITLILAFLVSLLTSAVPVQAAPGDVLLTVSLPTDTSFVGISIAYDGNSIYYTHYGDPTLYKTDLTGAHLGSIPVVDTLGNPWSVGPNALAWDSSRNLMWAGTWGGPCGIYQIDLSTGVATPAFTNLSPCPFGFMDGLAWDPVRDSLWWSDDVNHTISEIDIATGVTLRTINFGALTGSAHGNSGLAVDLNGLLFAGNNGGGTVFKLDVSVPGSEFSLGSYALVGGRDEDMECGPVYTKPDGTTVETLLVRGAYSPHTFDVVEMAPGECVSPTQPPSDPYTPGYWKNHEEHAASLLPVMVGSDSVDDFAEATAIFDNMNSKDVSHGLAGHLLATKLNLANNSANAACIQPAVSDADALLTAYPPGSGLVGGTKDPALKAARNQALALKDALDAYNNKTGPCWP